MSYALHVCLVLGICYYTGECKALWGKVPAIVTHSHAYAMTARELIDKIQKAETRAYSVTL